MEQDTLSRLNELNHIEIKSVLSQDFASFGNVVKGYEISDIVRYMEENTAIPDSGNIYVASEPGLEQTFGIAPIQEAFYGGLPVQAGYCNGKNRNINGFEYHKGSEINIAVTSFMLCLGHTWDITPDNRFSEKNVHVFYVPKGTVIELFQTTMHLSPICTEEAGFKACVILPKGTNTPLSAEEKSLRDRAFASGNMEARLLLQRNKWVIACPDRKPLTDQGAFPGFDGKNREFLF
ncbi:MAG: DUF4867 family protein [Candidatus Weimeria sp.]